MHRESRYLTEEAKRLIISEWVHEYTTSPHMTREDDELGLPDPDMIEWCAKINKLPGIVTTQSCAGHFRAGRWHRLAVLWLWATKEVLDQFDDLAMELAAEPRIDSVSRRYTQWGVEQIELVFWGNNESTVRLNSSMLTIMKYLRQITGCNLNCEFWHDKSCTASRLLVVRR